MIVTRKSVLTGVTRTLEIPTLKADDLAAYEKGYASITDAMPYLNTTERDFVLCGITHKEWKDAFNSQLDEIVNDKFGGF